MAGEPGELLQGTLEMMVLKTLSLEPMHGWGIAQRIQQMSKDVFLVTQGSLYPALIRMKRRGWLTTSWRVTEKGHSSTPGWPSSGSFRPAFPAPTGCSPT